MREDTEESQIGAILHEIMENLEEDLHIKLGNNEAIPHIAEFLFTGESRLPHFERLHRDFLNKKDLKSEHVSSWGEVIDILAPGNSKDDPEMLFEKMKQKRNLSEDQKIQIIQSAIEKAGQTK